MTNPAVLAEDHSTTNRLGGLNIAGDANLATKKGEKAPEGGRSAQVAGVPLHKRQKRRPLQLVGGNFFAFERHHGDRQHDADIH